MMYYDEPTYDSAIGYETHYELCDKLYEVAYDHNLADDGLRDTYTKIKK